MKSVLDLAEKPQIVEMEFDDYSFQSQMRPGQIVSQTWTTRPTRINNQPVDDQTTSD